MLTLYGCYRSRATRPLWALFETGMAFTHHPTIQAYRLPDPAAADAPANTASPDFLKVNPMGQIPAMVDGDLVLTESLAITLHIVRRAGGPIAPANDAETALMEQWALFASTAIEGPALDIAMTITKGQDKTLEDVLRPDLFYRLGAMTIICPPLRAGVRRSIDRSAVCNSQTSPGRIW